MLRPLQPQFKIRVFYNGGKVKPDTLKGSKVVVSPKGNYIDIEPCVNFPVIYEEQASLLNTLMFTVNRFADLLLYYFHIGQNVTLYGGYYSDSEQGMKHVFSGTVTRIRTHFADNGTISFSVECMNYGFTKMGKDFKNFVYPDMGSSRKFANADSLTLEGIIRGIAAENNYEIGDIDLPDKAKKFVFNKINVQYQKGISDWKFLTKLAQDFGCTVWTSSEDGVDKINFVSQEKAFKKQSDISFLFPLYEVTNNALKWDGKVKDSEMQTFNDSNYNRPRILREVNVEEDISQAYAVTRSALYFDKETGEYKEVVSAIESKDGKNYITFYELDEQRVEWVHQNMPNIADRIRENGPADLPWGDPNVEDPNTASYYYVAIKRYDETMNVFDKAFFGITVTAKCNQDLSIRSQRTYRLRGILSYHSKNLETSFFLRGLKHVWDRDGTWTELDFIR